jgi:hypothetical protein
VFSSLPRLITSLDQKLSSLTLLTVNDVSEHSLTIFPVCTREPRPTKTVVLPPSGEPVFHHLDRPVQVRAGVSQTKEPGLELRRREIDAGT